MKVETTYSIGDTVFVVCQGGANNDKFSVTNKKIVSIRIDIGALGVDVAYELDEWGSYHDSSEFHATHQDAAKEVGNLVQKWATILGG